jgi:hypothetical protein
MGREPGAQIPQPDAAGLTIPGAADEGTECRPGGLGMGGAMARAEAALGLQPALLEAQMQAQIPEQAAAGVVTGQGVDRPPGRRFSDMQRQQISEQGLEAIVLTLQQELTLEPGARPRAKPWRSLNRRHGSKRDHDQPPTASRHNEIMMSQHPQAAWLR